ncbi:uncharacterized protein N7477_005246 [Penicillium maclennaniae]|uniref:uncharacterized protein n=1 Tax=Penicillium maclennaniae TaxID=1343394 RepID=UPI00253FD0BE|nr:uncharacterized protein N7477_005246 [Penicillium maclennaniae]KAJ5675312.1 hypothetical protein N7477_005246 [Penicillium maclennaniae]
MSAGTAMRILPPGIQLVGLNIIVAQPWHDQRADSEEGRHAAQRRRHGPRRNLQRRDGQNARIPVQRRVGVQQRRQDGEARVVLLPRSGNAYSSSGFWAGAVACVDMLVNGGAASSSDQPVLTSASGRPTTTDAAWAYSAGGCGSAISAASTMSMKA